MAAYYLPLQTRGGQLAALRAQTQWPMFPIEPDLDKITVPTLIFVGRAGRTHSCCSRTEAERAHQAFKTCDL